jgi:hypothetical protein
MPPGGGQLLHPIQLSTPRFRPKKHTSTLVNNRFFRQKSSCAFYASTPSGGLKSVKSSNFNHASRFFSPRTSLAALGIKLRSLHLFETIGQHVHIHQKTIKHSPIEKLTDAFIAILAGAHGLCEINTRVRSDRALQRAFGRKSCAEQSVVQETLDRCTSENVRQMQRAVNEIFRKYSRSFSHPYKKRLQLLDIDMSGLPYGPQAEQATYGYFGRHHIRYGRQMGRVVAALYGEVVADRAFPGNLQLRDCLPYLVEVAEETLQLDQQKRARTLIRMDAGGGSINSINYLLKRGYQIPCKDYSVRRAANFAQYVREWVDDPRHPHRQLGWVAVKNVGYVREVQRLLMRWRKRNGQICYSILLSTLEPNEVMQLLGESGRLKHDSKEILIAYASLYDERGGAVEIEIKESKQGLGLTKRNKKRYAAQQMLMLLSSLAHNVVVWAKKWLVGESPRLERYGVPRIVRDVLHLSGFIEMEGSSAIRHIVLNSASALARQCAKSLRIMLKAEHVRVSLGET